MKRVLAILAALLLLPACSQAGWKKRALAVSVGVLVSAAVADTRSSYGGIEANPALGRGIFGPSQVAVKLSLTAAIVGGEFFVHRICKGKYDGALVVANFVSAGGLVAVTIRNERIK